MENEKNLIKQDSRIQRVEKKSRELVARSKTQKKKENKVRRKTEEVRWKLQGRG